MPEAAAPLTPNGDAKKSSSTNPITDYPKKKKLVRKEKPVNPIKYKLWLAGHSACIAFGIVTLVFQVLWLPNKWYINSIAYRLSLLGSVTALLATMSYKFGLHYLPPATTLLAQQNFQFIVLGLVWLFTFKSVFKIIPFFLISVLQLGNHKSIKPIEKESPFLASLIAYNELIFVFYLLLRTLFFRGTSGFQLVLFLVFYWLRILYNPETKNLFVTIVDRLDGKVQNTKNEKVLHYWNKGKLMLEQKTDGAA